MDTVDNSVELKPLEEGSNGKEVSITTGEEDCELKPVGEGNIVSSEKPSGNRPDLSKEEYNYLNNPGFSSEIFKIEGKLLNFTKTCFYLIHDHF